MEYNVDINIPETILEDARFIISIGLDTEETVFKSLEKYYASVENYAKAAQYRDVIKLDGLCH